MIDETQAPGCYGSALTFDMGSAECSQCMFAEQCGPRSAERMLYLREVLNLSPVLPKKKKAAASSAPAAGAVEFTIPKKVQAWLEQFEARGIKITEALRERRNPFETPPFMRIACHLLLGLRDGFDTKTLAEALVKKCDYTPQTAAAHAIQARQILLSVGAITFENGLMRLK